MIKGFTEAIREFQVRGWAFDPDQPNEHVVVELRRGSDTLGSAVADRPRGDLQTAGIGDGSHGFTINVNECLPLDDPGLLKVVARSNDGTERVLPLSATFRVEKLGKIYAASAEAATRAKGFFSVVNPRLIGGWAYDTDAPAQALQIELLCDGRRIAGTLADKLRPDLIPVCEGHAEHGFAFDLEQAVPELEKSATVFATDAKGRRFALLRAESNPQPGQDDQRRSEELIRFPGAASDQDQRPVFVLGAARSGTSAMSQALSSATRYKGPEEGHFLDLAASMLQTVQRHYAARGEEWAERATTLIAAAPKRFVEDGIKHIFVEFARASFPDGCWVDKTPRLEMTAAAHLMKDIWPNARFIFMRRRAIENVASRMRKFPGQRFDDYCKDWTASMMTWLSVRDALGASAIEIDQMDLVRNPEGVARALAARLGLDTRETDSLASAFRNDQPERTSVNLSKVTGLDEQQWSREQMAQFENLCGTAMRNFRYVTDATYWDMPTTLTWGTHVR